MKQIVIMAVTYSPIAIAWERPHCVFVGTWKQAEAYCEDKNKRAMRNQYVPIRVNTVEAEKKAVTA
jgi:hypothetical protein